MGQAFPAARAAGFGRGLLLHGVAVLQIAGVFTMIYAARGFALNAVP